MTRTSLSSVTCSIARTVDILGDAWTALILRDVLVGITRFDDIARDLGVSRKLLAARLERLVEEGILERRRYSEHPPRHDYLPTEKGADLHGVLLAIMAWGDRWTAGKAGPPALLRHEACGHDAQPEVACSHCGEELTLANTTPRPGPGGRTARGTLVFGPHVAAGAAGAAS